LSEILRDISNALGMVKAYDEVRVKLWMKLPRKSSGVGREPCMMH
jgi:hypothetical protein